MLCSKYGDDVYRYINEEKHPELYDFKDEVYNDAKQYYDEIQASDFATSNSRYIKNRDEISSRISCCEKLSETNPLRKHHIIKIYYLGKLNFDCDSSDGSYELTNTIYDILWGWHFTNYKMRHVPNNSNKLREFGKFWKELGLKLGSDTINSFGTTYKKAKEIYNRAHFEKKKTIYVSAENNPYIQEMAKLTHSIGNFSIIPHQIKFDSDGALQYFQWRGRNTGNIQDYWDLSLIAFRNYLVTDYGERVGNDIFFSYIETFYFNEYLNMNNEIIPLFEGHFERETPGPANESELNEYLKLVISKIISRGKTMVSQLRCCLP